MEFKAVRVFLGNLPPGVSEDDVKKKLKKHAIVNDVELRRRQDGSTFAFANLEDTPENIDKCFEQISAKPWKGLQVTVQLAKESFLQRLQKEREAQKSSPEAHNGSANAEADIVKRFESFSNIWKDDISAEELTKKHFFNSKAGHVNGNLFSLNINKEKASESNLRNSGKSLDIIPGKLSGVAKRKKEDRFSLLVSPCDITDQEVEERSVSDIIKETSEKKRLKSIEEQYKTYVQKKQVVKSALANINDTNRPNKKIIFDEEDYSDDEQNNYLNISYQKEKQEESRLVLFDDGDDDENHFEDFRIKSHFEGKKGQKLLELQARYGNDSRFRLDERFYESDEDHAEELMESPEKTQTEEEKYKMMQVLKNVLGDEAVAAHKRGRKLPVVSAMKRFDPTKPDNSTLEIKPEERKKKKRTALAHMDIDDVKEGVNIKDQSKGLVNETLPEVSKERFYQISDTLKEVLGRKESFSLLDMLKEDGEEEEGEEEAKNYEEARPIQQKVKWNLDPFKYDSSDEDEGKNDAKEAESLVEQGPAVKHETFFFLPVDHRFKEGMKFVKSSMKQEGMKSEKIQQIKNAVKHKLKLKQRDEFASPFRRRRK